MSNLVIGWEEIRLGCGIKVVLFIHKAFTVCSDSSWSFLELHNLHLLMCCLTDTENILVFARGKL